MRRIINFEKAFIVAQIFNKGTMKVYSPLQIIVLKYNCPLFFTQIFMNENETDSFIKLNGRTQLVLKPHTK